MSSLSPGAGCSLSLSLSFSLSLFSYVYMYRSFSRSPTASSSPLLSSPLLPSLISHPSSLLPLLALGPLTVWVTPDSWEDKFEEEKLWTKVYERVHPASHQDFVQLTLNEPVLVPKNCSVGMYVHSKLPGDEALVYDNQRSRFTHCKLATHTIEKLSLLLEDSPRLANC
jgi:hypothetical protein